MQRFAADLLPFLTQVFAISSMLSVGVTYVWQDIVGHLKDVKDVLLAVFANFVISPLLAWGLAELFSLADPYRAGLIIVSTAAGAPFLIKLVQIQKGDIAFVAALLVLCLPITVFYMPLVLPYVIEGGEVSAWDIAQPLLFSMLLPLAGGLILHAFWDDAGKVLNPFLGPISNLSMVALLIFTFIGNWNALTAVFGEFVLLAGLIYILLSFVIGYLVGGDKKREAGFSTAQRNIAAANVVAINAVGDPDTIISVIVISMAAMLVLFPIATWFGSQEREAEATAS